MRQSVREEAVWAARDESSRPFPFTSSRRSESRLLCRRPCEEEEEESEGRGGREREWEEGREKLGEGGRKRVIGKRSGS
eukprot:768536-Hanusia_phi.AAC.3